MEIFNSENFALKAKQSKNNIGFWYFDDIEINRNYLDLIYYREIDGKFIFRFYKIYLREKITIVRDKEEIKVDITDNNLKKLIHFFPSSIDEFFNKDNYIKNFHEFLLPENYEFKIEIVSQNDCKILDGEFIEKNILANEIIVNRNLISLRSISEGFTILTDCFVYKIKQSYIHNQKYYTLSDDYIKKPGFFTKIIRKLKSILR
jgi:hypothetical protein